MIKADVSVIIPCYKCFDTIERAVASIANQTLLPSEIILIEDHSGETTLNMLHTIQSVHPKGWIKIIALPNNKGPANARNAGWDIAKHNYVAFLDSDDSWHPQKIEIQYKWMMNHPRVSLTSHGYNRCTETTAKLKSRISINASEPITFTKKKLLLSNQICTSTVMLRRDVIVRFPPLKRYCEDYQLWLELCLNNYSIYKFNEVFTFTYKAAFGEKGLSSELWKMEMGELGTYYYFYKKKMLSFLGLAFLMISSLLKFLRRLTINCKSNK